MATADRIGIGHLTREVAGAMWSGTKRKVEVLVGHLLPTVVDRAISKAVEWYMARTSVDDQLQRLHMLSIMVHSAVEAADGVHIRSWWLRRWLWTLRDAAHDADEVLRFFRQRRAAEEIDAARQRSAKSLLFWRDEDSGIGRLSRMVARLEREAMGLGDFLKMLELQIRDEVVPLQVGRRRMRRPNEARQFSAAMSAAGGRYEARSSVDKQLEHLHMLLVMVRHIRLVLGSLAAVILGVAGRLIRKPSAPPPLASRAMILDAGELHDLVARIQLAVDNTRLVDLRGKRSWLDKWRGELQAVASRAEHVLLALPVKATPDGIHFVDDDAVEEVWRMAQTAAAHLEDFVTLVGLAHRRQMGTTIRRPQHFSNFFLSLFFSLVISVCVAGVAICVAAWFRTGGVLFPGTQVTDGRRYLCAVCQH